MCGCAECEGSGMIITYGSKQTSSPKVCLSFGLNDFEMTIPFGAAILALYSIQNCGWLDRQTLQICFFSAIPTENDDQGTIDVCSLF